MTLTEFLKKWNGQYCEVAGSANAKNQCVDLANAYIRDVLGLPIIEWTNAKDFPSKSSLPFIRNLPTGIPNEGDMVIWGNGTAGHIAIFLSGNVNSFTSFDQNYPVGSPCHSQGHTYANVLGWLKSSATINPPANSGNVEPITDDKARIDLGNPFGVLEVGAIKSRLNDTIRDLENQKNQVTTLGNTIDDLKSSYGQEIIKLTEKEKATKEAFDNFLSKVAGLLGESQDIPTIIASLTALVKENSDLKKKLEGVTSNQPIVIHNGLSKVVEFIEKVIINLKKKWRKQKKSLSGKIKSPTK